MICEDCGRETLLCADLDGAPICSRCIKVYEAEYPGQRFRPVRFFGMHLWQLVDA